MMRARLTANEPERLEALRRFGILDTIAEQDFDDLASLAAQVCGTPIALVSLVDAEREWFKAKVGLSATQISRESSLSAHAILQSGLFVVPDTLADERFAENPLVLGEPRIRFYAAAPLITSDGHNLGTLSVLDSKPGGLTREQGELLFALGRQLITLMELRRSKTDLLQTATAGKAAEEALRASLLSPVSKKCLRGPRPTSLRSRRI